MDLGLKVNSIKELECLPNVNALFNDVLRDYLENRKDWCKAHNLGPSLDVQKAKECLFEEEYKGRTIEELVERFKHSRLYKV